MELGSPLHLSVVAIEKGAFGSPSMKVANFTYIYDNFLNIFTMKLYSVIKTKKSTLVEKDAYL